MPAAAPTALQYLGSRVFSDHALNLKQEIVLRGAADRAVQESNLRARAVKLVDQEHLMGVAAGKPVRIHVERFNPARRLYDRLGFHQTADEGVYLQLEWRPGS